jgi:hypothetical protein
MMATTPWIPDMEALVGNTTARILADKGYRGHNAPPDYKSRVFLSGQKRRGDAANQARAPPSSPSSAISRPSTAWAATISDSGAATPPTPSSPPPATTSDASSAGSGFCCAILGALFADRGDQSCLKSAFFTDD